MNSLTPTATELRAWMDAASDWLIDYLGNVADRPVYATTSSREIRSQLDAELPQTGVEFEQLIRTFREVIVPLTRQNAHPRMFGYVQSPGIALAAIGDLLASGLNSNLTVWRSAPAPVELERLTIDWIRQILGFAPGAGGLFVSGGSVANLSALVTARDSRRRDSATTSELPQLRIYASAETHHSIAKAANLLGLGRDSVRQIRVNRALKISVEHLREEIRHDLSAGYEPFGVVANAGTVNTGACDPLRTVREVADEFGLWMHVDASYGGFAILAPEARGLFDGIAEADSVALDPHKWLYLPVDCGCVIYRDPSHARGAFSYEAEYTRVLGQEADEAFAFWDYGPELSRRFRALKVWMLLKGVGLQRLGAAIAKDIGCARHLEQLVQASDDFEMLAPVELSIFCFRHLWPARRERSRGGTEGAEAATDNQLDIWNEKLLVALQRDGSSYLSNTRVAGRFALRGCVMNYRTQPSDMELLLEDIRRVARELAA